MGAHRSSPLGLSLRCDDLAGRTLASRRIRSRQPVVPVSRVGFYPTTATTETATVAEGPRVGGAQIQGRATLLVVDDEEMVRRLAARMLVTLGYRVVEAHDGNEAVRVLQRDAHRIDAVVTDIAMPGLNGKQLG